MPEVDGIPADAPDEIKDAARRVAAGGEVADDPAGERSALGWLLGRTIAPRYTVKVKYETPDGMKTLVFHLKALDPDKIETVDSDNRDGEGPLAKLNTPSYNAQLVTEATEYIQDESGRKVDPRSEEFRGEVPDPNLAMKMRFKYQPGLLQTLVDRINYVSAYTPDRVGTAQRAIVDAVGGSSSVGD